MVRSETPKAGRAQAPFGFSQKATGTKARVEEMSQQIVTRRIDLTASEPDWFRLACAFANEFGEEGRAYFHAVSQFHPGYGQQEADRKFDHALKGGYRRIGIGTFFTIAKILDS